MRKHIITLLGIFSFVMVGINFQNNDSFLMFCWVLAGIMMIGIHYLIKKQEK